MITITLEGNTWQDILDEMAIIQDAAKASRIDDLSGQVDIANPCQKCQHDRHNKLTGILKSGYGLGSEEVAEIKAYYEAHKEEINAHNVAYQKAHPEKYREYERKRKERKAREETCKILKEHKQALADDPERLSTDFILKLVRGES